ncbi:MAG: metallophosphatase family protein [Candidatus Syntrophoarchaeum sp. GoM_oil]|nr:MAG: metallophosphatase family protein [Candidatus Syntrophoarchaeum sp. GoM_oil]
MSDLVISDIHADIESLERILKVTGSDEFVGRYGNVDRIFNLGDVVERGYHPQEVIDRLISLGEELKVISIRGNHDEAFLYRYEISGSDKKCEETHEKLRSNEEAISYINSFLPYYISGKSKILIVHGGPLDPLLITSPGASRREQWLHERSWQRISTIKFEYFNTTGYHYTPESAFIYTSMIFEEDDYLILCGHEHKFALFECRNGLSRSILNEGKAYSIEIDSVQLMVREFERRAGSSYLLRVGIAGIEGYKKHGFTNPQFGLLFEDEEGRRMGLFEIE